MKKLWQKIPQKSLGNGIRLGLLALVLSGLIAFTGERRQKRQIRHIEVEIENNHENHFVDEETVLNMLAAQNQDLLMGKRVHELRLRKLEHQLMENTFIRKANIAHSIAGNMHIVINQVKPLARILVRGGADHYLGSGGRLVPFNPRFTARVPIIETQDSSYLKDGAKRKQLTRMMSDIQQDPLLAKQIAFVDIDHKGRVDLLLQVGKQRIELGTLEDYKAKFKKLKVFFDQVLPKQGWNAYQLVNLEYEDQIICQ